MKTFSEKQYETFKAAVGKGIAEGLPSGFVPMGWVAIVEYVGDDGERSLVKVDENLPQWHLDGLLHTALHGDWDEGDTSD